jgi:hypothetical protein
MKPVQLKWKNAICFLQSGAPITVVYQTWLFEWRTTQFLESDNVSRNPFFLIHGGFPGQYPHCHLQNSMSMPSKSLLSLNSKSYATKTDWCYKPIWNIYPRHWGSSSLFLSLKTIRIFEKIRNHQPNHHWLHPHYIILYPHDVNPVKNPHLCWWKPSCAVESTIPGSPWMVLPGMILWNLARFKVLNSPELRFQSHWKMEAKRM